jgi:transposase
MYIRKTTRKHKNKTYTSYLLVESVATPKGPRQRTICSLGNLSPRPREEWLKIARKMHGALAGQEELFDEPPEVGELLDEARERSAQRASSPARRRAEASPRSVSVDPDKVSVESVREAGTVHVGLSFWKRLGLDEALRAARLSERTRVLTCAMVMNRLIAPTSEHAMPAWIRRTALSDLLDVSFESLSESALYRNMDRLYPRRELIESVLVERERELFNLDQTIFFYDLTSTYFEGQALANPKAKRGYSRDKRPDCKQVVVGLVINRDGFPQAHEIFDGNTQDRASLPAMLDRLEERLGGFRPGQTVVVDRGMAFDENLEQLRERGLHYLVASRQPERNRWLAEFEDLEGFDEVIRRPSPRNPHQRKSKVEVKLKRTQEETYVLCISDGRKDKDRAIRDKHEQRLLRDLEKLQARIDEGRLTDTLKVGQAIGRLKERYPRVARYYDITFDAHTGTFSYTANEPRRRLAEHLDGSYVLKTDRVDLSADEAWRIYNLLTRAENAFRCMKSPLAERPIFHQVERRVETHIFLCVLAYHLLVAIEKTLLDQGVHTSWASVRDALETHQVATIVLPTDTGPVLRLRKASTPQPEHRDLYRLLGVSETIVRPKKTWSESSAAR